MADAEFASEKMLPDDAGVGDLAHAAMVSGAPVATLCVARI
jgi:hypothetical protein